MFINVTMTMLQILHLSFLIASIGLLISLAEDIKYREVFSRHGILAWEIGQTRFTHRLAGLSTELLDPLLREGRYIWVQRMAFGIAALSPATLLVPDLLPWFAVMLLASIALQTMRNLLGTDGADQMNIVVLTAVALGSSLPSGGLGQRACCWFVAVQLMLSYFIAGVAKIRSESWRSGVAIRGILGTESYGNASLDRLIAWHPIIPRLLCWGVMAFELAFPLVLLQLPELTLSLVLMGIGFHAVCALVMGLNGFLWAFSSAYPSLLWCTGTIKYIS